MSNIRIISLENITTRSLFIILLSNFPFKSKTCTFCFYEYSNLKENQKLQRETEIGIIVRGKSYLHIN